MLPTIQIPIIISNSYHCIRDCLLGPTFVKLPDHRVVMEYFTTLPDNELNRAVYTAWVAAVSCWADLRKFKRTKDNKDSYQSTKMILRQSADSADKHWYRLRTEQKRRQYA